MNDKQNELVQEFIRKHGDTTVVEEATMRMVQLQLGEKVSKNVGVSLHWLIGFKKHFKNISIGVSYRETAQCCMYISMFYK